MSITAKLKIWESDGNRTKVNIPQIVHGIIHEGAKYEDKDNVVILEVSVPTRKVFIELKRRLAAKKDRPNTRISVLEYEETT